MTSWTTKDKKIFPTPEEIAQGRYWIHDDGKGAEAPTNPGQIYKMLTSQEVHTGIIAEEVATGFVL